jgi:uncharacterized membrane-anchored protein
MWFHIFRRLGRRVRLGINMHNLYKMIIRQHMHNPEAFEALCACAGLVLAFLAFVYRVNGFLPESPNPLQHNIIDSP